MKGKKIYTIPVIFEKGVRRLEKGQTNLHQNRNNQKSNYA